MRDQVQYYPFGRTVRRAHERRRPLRPREQDGHSTTTLHARMVPGRLQASDNLSRPGKFRARRDEPAVAKGLEAGGNADEGIDTVGGVGDAEINASVEL